MWRLKKKKKKKKKEGKRKKSVFLKIETQADLDRPTDRVRAVIGPYDDLSIVKTRKLRWYGHVTRATGLANTIMQGTVPGGRRRGRPKKMLATSRNGRICLSPRP